MLAPDGAPRFSAARIVFYLILYTHRIVAAGAELAATMLAPCALAGDPLATTVCNQDDHHRSFKRSRAPASVGGFQPRFVRSCLPRRSLWRRRVGRLFSASASQKTFRVFRVFRGFKKAYHAHSRDGRPAYASARRRHRYAGTANQCTLFSWPPGPGSI